MLNKYTAWNMKKEAKRWDYLSNANQEDSELDLMLTHHKARSKVLKERASKSSLKELKVLNDSVKSVYRLKINTERKAIKYSLITYLLSSRQEREKIDIKKKCSHHIQNIRQFKQDIKACQ